MDAGQFAEFMQTVVYVSCVLSFALGWMVAK